MRKAIILPAYAGPMPSNCWSSSDVVVLMFIASLSVVKLVKCIWLGVYDISSFKNTNIVNIIAIIRRIPLYVFGRFK